MIALEDCVKRTCALCSSAATPCSIHQRLEVTPDGLTPVAVEPSGNFKALRDALLVDSMTMVSPTPGQDAMLPGAFLQPVFRVIQPTTATLFYSGYSLFIHDVYDLFSSSCAQRYLRGIFDSLYMRDISEAELKDAFFFEEGEPVFFSFCQAGQGK